MFFLEMSTTRAIEAPCCGVLKDGRAMHLETKIT